MILRTLSLVGGLTGAAAFSQFPEFSQQYVQRLGGAVDALSEVVADFDASAKAEGLTREAALAQMTGSAFVERRQTDMIRAIERQGALRSDLDVLTRAGPFMRAYHAGRADRDVARAAWQAFEPALPLTFAGMVFAATGFVLGLLAMSGLGSVCRMCWTAAFKHRAAGGPAG